MEGTEQEPSDVADVGEDSVTDGHAVGGTTNVAILKQSVCMIGQSNQQNDDGGKTDVEDINKDNEKCPNAADLKPTNNDGISNGALDSDECGSTEENEEAKCDASTDDKALEEYLENTNTENTNANKSGKRSKCDVSETTSEAQSVMTSEHVTEQIKIDTCNSNDENTPSVVEVTKNMEVQTQIDNNISNENKADINDIEHPIFSISNDSASEICKDNHSNIPESNESDEKSMETVNSENEMGCVDSLKENKLKADCENIDADLIIKEIDNAIANENHATSVSSMVTENYSPASLKEEVDSDKIVIETKENLTLEKAVDGITTVTNTLSDDQVDTNSIGTDNADIHKLSMLSKQIDTNEIVMNNNEITTMLEEHNCTDVTDVVSAVDKQADENSTVTDKTETTSANADDSIILTALDKHVDTNTLDSDMPNESVMSDNQTVTMATVTNDNVATSDKTVDAKATEVMDVDTGTTTVEHDEMEVDSSIDIATKSADSSLDATKESEEVEVGVEHPADVSSDKDTEIITSPETGTNDMPLPLHTAKSPIQESMLTKIKSKGQKLDQLLSKLKPTSVMEQDNTVNDPTSNIPKVHVAKARKSCANSKTLTNVPQSLPAQISNFTFNVKELEKQGVLDVPRVQKRKAFEPFKFHVRTDEKCDIVPAKTSPVKSPVKSPKSESPFFRKGKAKRFFRGKRKKKKRMGGYKLPGEKKTYKRKKDSEERQLNYKREDVNSLSDAHIESIHERTFDVTVRNASVSPSSVTSAGESRTSPKSQNALDLLTQNSKRSFTVSPTANLKKAKITSRTGIETASHMQTLDSFLNFPRLSSTITQSQGPGFGDSHGSTQLTLRKRKATGGSAANDTSSTTAVSMVSPEEKKRKTDTLGPISALSPPQPQFITLLPTMSPPMQLAPGIRSIIPSSVGGPMQNVTLVPIGQPQPAPAGLLPGTTATPPPPHTIIQNGNLKGLPMFHIMNGPLSSGAQLITIGQSQANPLLTQAFPQQTTLIPSKGVVPPGLPVYLTAVNMPTVLPSASTASVQMLQPTMFPTQTGASIMTTLSITMASLSTAPLLTTASTHQLNPAMTWSLISPNKSLHKTVLQRQGLTSPFTGSKLFDVSAELKKQGIVIPNGLSITPSPPRTVDSGVSSDSGSQESVGVTPGQPVPPDKDVIPLCTCKINGASFQKLASAVTYCQALDSVDGKVMGCCNKVTSSQLVRPAVKIPFLAVCESHRKRLRLHQSCPGCGHFCTQGKFYQCRKEGSTSLHNFHEQCQVVRGDKVYCPHCGETSPQYEITLALPENKAAPVMETKSSRIQTKAKMSVVGERRAASEERDETVISHTLDKAKKTLSTSDLPFGPDRYSLERVLSSLTQERPKKYRHLPKCLYTPAYDKDLERTVYMLEDGHNPNEKYGDLEDQTALHAAASQGSLVIVHVLIQAGALPHVQDKNLRTPLMYATENGQADVVRYLIKAGTVLDSKADDGMTALHYAAKSGHVNIIQILLDTDQLNIDITDDGGYTPLIWAAEHQELDVVKLLLKRNAAPNLRDTEENTSLHWAAFSGCVHVAEVLLAAGCELDSLNMHGDTPLHIAARQDHYECVVLFLARGANVELKNNKNDTPVESCIDENSTVALSLKVNRQLKSFGAKHMGRPEKLLHRDLSKGRENIPIPCVNNMDDSGIPTDYLYVTDNIETKCLNVNRVIGSLQCCQCKDDCSSIYCACGKNSVKCWYDKFSRLLPDFNMMEPPLIFECNRACECWTTCNNRVVQNGVMSRLQVFRTDSRGWGCRTLIDIQRGTFICEYIGEHISDSEADRREDDSYLFDLDNRDGETYCIDARKYGNVARFINHLCDPNLVPVKVFVDSQDLRFPRICLFASKDIKAGEELGFDYGEKFWIIKWKQFTCTCGQEKCRYSIDAIQKTLEEYRQRHEEDAEPAHS